MDQFSEIINILAFVSKIKKTNGKSLSGGNREDPYSEYDPFEKNNVDSYILEGNNCFTLKDYEVFELNLN